jgi:hypothetical protein
MEWVSVREEWLTSRSIIPISIYQGISACMSASCFNAMVEGADDQEHSEGRLETCRFFLLPSSLLADGRLGMRG